MGSCGPWRVLDKMEAHGTCRCASKLACHGHRRSALAQGSRAWHCSMCLGKAGTADLMCKATTIDGACFRVTL